MAWLCSRSTTSTEHPACSCTLLYGPPYSNERCCQSLSDINSPLTLCQVTTSEVDTTTKLLDKACQKQISPRTDDKYNLPTHEDNSKCIGECQWWFDSRRSASIFVAGAIVFRLVTTLEATCGPAGNRTTTGSLSASTTPQGRLPRRSASRIQNPPQGNRLGQKNRSYYCGGPLLGVRKANVLRLWNEIAAVSFFAKTRSFNKQHWNQNKWRFA